MTLFPAMVTPPPRGSGSGGPPSTPCVGRWSHGGERVNGPHLSDSPVLIRYSGMRKYLVMLVLGLMGVSACSEGSTGHVGVRLADDDPDASALNVVLEVYNLGSETVGPVNLVVEQVREVDESGAVMPDAEVDVDPAQAPVLAPGQILTVDVTLDTLTVDYGRYVADMRAEIGKTHLDVNVLFEYADTTATDPPTAIRQDS